MNTPFLAVLVAAMLTGCAADGTRVAYDDRQCIVAPSSTANAVNPNRRQVTELEQRDAVNRLAGTSYYQRNLQERPESTIVQARRDCY